MKVLHLSITLFLVLTSVTSASEKNSSLDNYISDTKKELFDFDYKKNKVDSSILRDSWITPIDLRYSYSRSNPYSKEQLNQAAAIKMDQPIFKGGGIFYGIKYANASKDYSEYSIDVAKRKMIKDAISILMQIKQSDIKIKKQKLQIKNSEINLALKQEQYLSGQLDSGFLDNAIIERNVFIQNLYDIETSKERFISSFNSISDLDYKNVQAPTLELISQEEFLHNNISLEMAKSQVIRDGHNKGVVRAKYLPTISVTAGYNWTQTDGPVFGGVQERDYYDYGVKANMPLNINTFRDIESARIDYLKSETLALDKQRELKALFEQVMQNLNNLEKKKELSLENISIYSKLLDDTKELFSAGYKTEYDVQTLENSVGISQMNYKVYEIDKQLELLNLYEMYVNE